MLREIWFFVSESLSVPFPTWSNVPSALQIPLPHDAHRTHTVLKVPSALKWGDVTGKSCVGRGSVGSFPCLGYPRSEKGRGQSVLCSGGDAVLGNWSWGHLPQTCHQQVKRPCPVLSLITPLAKGGSFPGSVPALLLAPRKPLPFS